MVFTDDDLKRLKEKLLSTHHGDSFHIDRHYCEALLARLEAAEKVIESLSESEDLADLRWFAPTHKFYCAWKKVAGKTK